jgi:glutamate N-acetyltransferase/amino-acid N-acetyltransferase
VTRTPGVPAGFRVGGTTAGIKPSGKPDLMLVATTQGAAATAAVFTANAFAAAPVRLSQELLLATEPTGHGRFGWSSAVVSTSGCANAATGDAGLADQREIAGHVAAALGIPVERTLHLSTGLIGTRLPLDKVAAALPRLAADELGATPATSRRRPWRFVPPTPAARRPARRSICPAATAERCACTSAASRRAWE